MKQKDIKACHDSLCQALRGTQKVGDRGACRPEKNDVLSGGGEKNHNMVAGAEPAPSVSVGSGIGKAWLVD